MTWNFDSVDLNAIAVGISAPGTLAAARSALASWHTSKKALQLQNGVYLYESLKACAERVNSSAKDKRGSEWSVNDAADIVRCLVWAMELIRQGSQQEEDNQALVLRQYFVSLLVMELYEEVRNSDAADSVFKSTEPTQVLDNLWSKWQKAIAFFDTWNYPVATEEDLAD